jgi:hypothetical protein
MPATIVGELTADRGSVILIAVGDDWEVANASRALQVLTPLCKPTNPAGALTVPASWPAVVQLAAVFGPFWRPGPALSAWLVDQVRRRTAVGSDLCTAPPAGMVPRAYQVAGACMIGATGRALLFDDPGCISGDALMAVNRNGKGFTLPLRDLVARFNGTATHSGPKWDLSKMTCVQREVDGVIRLGRIVNAWSSGVKTTYTVATETGRTIRATDEHPFLTERGWVRLDALVPGDLVRVRGQQKTTGRLIKQRYRELAGLRSHPYARGADRRASPYRVAYHRLVAEARLNSLAVDDFVQRVRGYSVIGLRFLDPAVTAVHHIDRDPANNAAENLQVLTHAEHHRLHCDEGKTSHVLFKTALERVSSVTLYGEEETFDIEVADEPHNFLADGFVVHNTGKTITTILGLVERWAHTEQHAPVTPIVVVAPSSVVDPWVDEFRKWAPQWRVRAWRGSPQRRRNLAGTADVYVTSYGTARRDAADTNARTSPLIGLRPASVVADEVHMIKHQNSAQSRAVRRLASGASNFVGLSGTPITHSPADLWPALVALEPGAWPSGERWVQRYCTSLPGDYRSTPLGLDPQTESEFRTTLLGRHRRVSKADVLAELPPKVYSIRTVELPTAYRAAYDGMALDMLAQMPDGEELSVMGVLAQLGRLAQLASAAADIETTTEIVLDAETGLPIERVHQKVTLKAPSWKVDALLEVLEERPSQPVVAFAPSRQLIMLAAAAATSAGLRVGYIVGGQTPKERTAQREAFQAGRLDLLCVTTGAGGVGLTLTAARTAVFLQRPWSLVEAMQAEDRLHRIGAELHESIEIIDIVARKTIDTHVRKILRERAGQLSDLVQDPRIVAQLLGGSGDGEQRTTKRKVAA